MNNERKKKNWPREMEEEEKKKKEVDKKDEEGRSWRIKEKLRKRRMGRRKVTKFSLYISFLISHSIFFLLGILPYNYIFFLSSSSPICFLFLIHKLFIITTNFYDIKSILFLLELFFLHSVFIYSSFLPFLLDYNEQLK